MFQHSHKDKHIRHIEYLAKQEEGAREGIHKALVDLTVDGRKDKLTDGFADAEYRIHFALNETCDIRKSDMKF